VRYLLAILGGGLLTALLALGGRKITSTPSSLKSSLMNDTSTSDNTEQQEQQLSVSGGASQEQSTETNPLKRYQDLVNSPTTPDGHKVVAAVAAASTVTVAAVANWLMSRKK
jgi:hypothetical protein